MKRIGETFKLAASVFGERVPKKYREGYDEKADSLAKVAETLNRAVESAEADRSLSADGRDTTTAKAAAFAVSGIEAWMRTGPNVIGERVKTGRVALLSRITSERSSDPGVALVKEMRAGEIRNDWKRLDPLTRNAMYQGEHDPATLDALENAPPVLVQGADGTMFRPMIDPALVQARRLDRARAVDPQGAAELDELSNLADTYRSLGGMLREEILAEFPAAREQRPGIDPRTNAPVPSFTSASDAA